MIRTRVLAIDEYHRLRGTELESVWEALAIDAQRVPHMVKVIVAEQGSDLLGCWALVRVTHVEGVWIRPDARHTGVVARHLIRAMKQHARADGAEVVLTGAKDATVQQLIVDHLKGVPLELDDFVTKQKRPVPFFAIPVKE